MISDTKPIYQLCHDELGYDFPEAQIEANIRRMMGEANNLLLVAESRGEVVGFIHAHNHEPVYAPPMKSVVALAILPEYRHQGLGRTLIPAVEDWNDPDFRRFPPDGSDGPGASLRRSLSPGGKDDLACSGW